MFVCFSCLEEFGFEFHRYIIRVKMRVERRQGNVAYTAAARSPTSSLVLTLGDQKQLHGLRREVAKLGE